MCYHRDTGIGRAVNIQSKDHIEKFEERLLKELDVLRLIDHPNVIKLLDIYEDSRHYYVVTELLTGGDLLEHIAPHKCFTEHNAAVIMKQILSGVAYCHSKNIVHRDIKPGNIMFETHEETSKLRIVDFATSDIYDPLKKMNEKIGSPYYIAPEVLKGSYTEKCDIWSCGVILYVLLAGYFPFRGKKKSEVLLKISKGEYQMIGKEWEAVSKEGKHLVINMLKYNPSDRFSAAQALSHKWIQEYTSDGMSVKLTRDILEHLQKFHRLRKLQQAVLIYIASQFTTRSEKEALSSVFLRLDKDSNGLLGIEELISGYKEVYGDFCDADVIKEIIMESGLDKGGKFNYTEFIAATIDRRKLLSEEKLIATFKMFDTDNSGTIDIKDIQHVITGNEGISDQRWIKLINEDNFSNKGEITQEEFIATMKGLLKE